MKILHLKTKPNIVWQPV